MSIVKKSFKSLIRPKPEPKVEVEDENFGYLVPDKVKERVKDTAFL